MPVPKRVREYPNADMPSTAISFPRAELELLRRMAKADDRSLASLVRKAVEYFLKSADGRELARKTQQRTSMAPVPPDVNIEEPKS